MQSSGVWLCVEIRLQYSIRVPEKIGFHMRGQSQLCRQTLNKWRRDNSKATDLSGVLLKKAREVSEYMLGY